MRKFNIPIVILFLLYLVFSIILAAICITLIFRKIDISKGIELDENIILSNVWLDDYSVVGVTPIREIDKATGKESVEWDILKVPVANPMEPVTLYSLNNFIAVIPWAYIPESKILVVNGINADNSHQLLKLELDKPPSEPATLYTYRNLFDICISPDARKLLYMTSEKNKMSGIWLVDLATRKNIQVGAVFRNSSHCPSFSPEGTRVAFSYTEDPFANYSLLGYIELATRKIHNLGKTQDHFKITEISWSKDGENVFYISSYSDADSNMNSMKHRDFALSQYNFSKDAHTILKTSRGQSLHILGQPPGETTLLLLQFRVRGKKEQGRLIKVNTTN